MTYGLWVQIKILLFGLRYNLVDRKYSPNQESITQTPFGKTKRVANKLLYMEEETSNRGP